MQIRSFFVSVASLALGLLLSAPMAGAAGVTKGNPVAPFTPKFQPGDYVWLPQMSPAGRW